MSISAGLINRAKKFPQRALVQKSGRSAGTISQIISGKNPNPTVETLAAFETAVKELEKDRKKERSRSKADKKQTPSRDTKRRSVAGGKA